MEEKQIIVPYIVYEGEMARAERRDKRHFIVTLILIICLVLILYESQFVDEVTNITQDNESGYNNFIGNDGDIYNGEADDNP